MIRPDKRAHEIFVAAQEHQEAQNELAVEIRASADKKALATANIERLSERHPRKFIEELTKSADDLIQQQLQEKQNLVVEKMLAQAAAERLETSFLCPQCGKEFPNGAHIDILVASVIEFDETGRALPERIDFGIAEVFKTQMGRRMKFCALCIETWAIRPVEYVNMR